MKNNKVKILSLLVGSVLASQASAEVFNINSMQITSGNLVRSFNPNDITTPIELDFTGNTDLVGGFINRNTTADDFAISETNFRMVKDINEPTQYVYTAATNIRHNFGWEGDAPIDDMTLFDPSYVVPTGTVDDEAGTITTIVIDTATYTSLDKDGKPIPIKEDADEFEDEEFTKASDTLRGEIKNSVNDFLKDKLNLKNNPIDIEEKE